MCTRAIQVFGFDYMVVLYLYFPEESKIFRRMKSTQSFAIQPTQVLSLLP
jgi:hypothetical protein